MIRALLTASILSFTAPLVAQAQSPTTETAAAEIGPRVGSMAPDFSATTSIGERVDLAKISGTNGAVIVFSRSLDWCPFCKKQAIELEAVAGPLSEAGWTLSLLTYDPPATLTAFAEAQSISYTLLSDPDSAMINAFKLRNTEMTPGSRFDGIPHPAIVWIGNDGRVRGFMREEGYKDRPPSEALPEVANLLNAAIAAE